MDFHPIAISRLHDYCAGGCFFAPYQIICSTKYPRVPTFYVNLQDKPNKV